MNPITRFARIACALIFTTTLFAPDDAAAADHKDGANVTAQPYADITDFFAFPRTHDGQRRLSMILSVHPSAAPDALFSDALHYRMRLRPVTGFSRKPYRANVAQTEHRIDCRVTGVELQVLTCTLSRVDAHGRSKQLATARVNTRDPSGGSNPDFRVFGGPRADQLFTDRARVRMPVWRSEGFNNAEEWPGVNSFDGKNVLSIVVDIDAKKLLGNAGDGLLAAVAESALIDPKAPGGLRQLDRMGRVEITVFIVRDNAVRELWNADDTFNLDPANIPKYKEQLISGLRRLDGFEKLDIEDRGQDIYDWPFPHPWVQLLMDDFLILDMRKSTTPGSTKNGYLSIEILHYDGMKRGDLVGGRVPNEDVINRTLTVFINGLKRPKPQRGVGVPAPARPVVDEFPFAAPPFQNN